MQSNFYVYEHIRRDDRKIFYVGKGKGDRAWRTNNRNPYWRAVVAKHGFEVRVQFETDCEELALLVEVELIRKRRLDGVALSNLTDGGEGVSGLKRVQTPGEIEKRRAANTGRRRTPEQFARIARAKRGHGQGKSLSESHRARISESLKGLSKPMPKLRGRSRPPHVISALKKANDLRYGDTRRRIVSAIRLNPNSSAASIARLVGCNRDTVRKYKNSRSEEEI